MRTVAIMAASCLVTLWAAQVNAEDTKTDNKDQKTAVGVKTDITAKKGKVQTNCPVQGGEIRKNLYADVKGKRIYVCCAGCTDVIKADPDKYIKILEDQGVEIEKTPAAAVSAPAADKAKAENKGMSCH